MALLLYIIAPCALFGASIASQPLSRRGYWLRLGLWLLLTLALMAGFYLAYIGHVRMIRSVWAYLLLGYIVLTCVYYFLWSAMRAIDAGGSRWWALLAFLPGSFLVFGLAPSRPPREREAADLAAVFG